MLIHKRSLGDYARPQREPPTGHLASPKLPIREAPAISPRNHRSTLARIPATHPTPPRRKRHPPSVQPLRDYLFNRSKSLQGLPAFRCRFVDRGFARDRFQKLPSGQQIQIRQNRFKIQVCPVDDIGFGYSRLQADFEDLSDDLICASAGHQD